MKTTRLLLLILLPLLVMACGRGGDRESLVRLDSLAWTAPDSAWHRLVSLPADSLPTAGDRAYHAVLVAEAAYRAYRPATSDSAILAAERHYARGDRAKHLRALMACGTTAEELGHPEQAMRRYKQAEALARDLRDTFRTGYALLRQAELYHGQQNTAEIAINRYKSAMECFDAVHSEHYRYVCCLAIGSLYRIIDVDSALSYLNDYYCYVSRKQDIDKICGIKLQLANLYLLEQNDYARSLPLALDVIRDCHTAADLVHSHLTAANCYVAMGRYDSAEYLLSRCPRLIDMVDTMTYHYVKAKLYRAKGDFDNYCLHHLKSDSISDSIITSTAALDIQAAEHRYEQAEMELKLSRTALDKKRRESVALYALLGMVALLAIIVTGIGRLRKRREEMKSLEHDLARLRQTNDEVSALLVSRQQMLEQTRQQYGSVIEAAEVRAAILDELFSNIQITKSPIQAKRIEVRKLPERFWSKVDRYAEMVYPSLVCYSLPENVVENRKLTLHAIHVPVRISALCFGYTNHKSFQNEIKRIVKRRSDNSTDFVQFMRRNRHLP